MFSILIWGHIAYKHLPTHPLTHHIFSQLCILISRDMKLARHNSCCCCCVSVPCVRMCVCVFVCARVCVCVSVSVCVFRHTVDSRPPRGARGFLHTGAPDLAHPPPHLRRVPSGFLPRLFVSCHPSPPAPAVLSACKCSPPH